MKDFLIRERSATQCVCTTEVCTLSRPALLPFVAQCRFLQETSNQIKFKSHSTHRQPYIRWLGPKRSQLGSISWQELQYHPSSGVKNSLRPCPSSQSAMRPPLLLLLMRLLLPGGCEGGGSVGRGGKLLFLAWLLGGDTGGEDGATITRSPSSSS